MKYIYRWCSNRARASRFIGWREEGDTIETRVVEASNDAEALRSILDDVDYASYYEDYEEHNTVESLIDALDSIDIDGGYEFVFWIKREDGTEVYKSCLDEDDFVGDPCEDDKKMNVEKEMIKDIKSVCPFYNVDIPKTISCSRVEPSESGYDYYENDNSDADGMLWDYASFEGEFIYAGFTCKLSRRVMGYDIELDDFDITETPSSPKGFETLIKELDFVKQVLLQSDYI